MIWLDLTVPFTLNILLVLPISFLGFLIEKRFTCLSYSICILYLIYRICLWIQIGSAFFTLPYANLMILTGVLHMIEGIMVWLSRHEKKEVIIAYKRNKLVGGYHIYNRWVIPLLFFYINGIYIPLAAVTVYADDTYIKEPGHKTAVMGGLILAFGIIVALLGYGAFKGVFPLDLAVICMPLLHEQLFKINQKVEDKMI